MKYLYLCVNYDSSGILKETMLVWRKFCSDIDIYIVDNFKSDQERMAVSKICKEFNATLICNENNGYGGALNKGIDVILSSANYDSKNILFFGNADIVPVKPILPIKNNGVPILNIYQDGKKLNPFLTKFESKFIWILCLSAKLRSKTLLYLWYLFRKLISLCKGRTVVAVHGSLFCLSLADVAKLHPIFNPKVFLYCEELFFMRKVARGKLDYSESSYVFDHIGSVSTGKSIKLNDEAYFNNWCKSMRIYCDD